MMLKLINEIPEYLKNEFIVYFEKGNTGDFPVTAPSLFKGKSSHFGVG